MNILSRLKGILFLAFICGILVYAILPHNFQILCGNENYRNQTEFSNFLSPSTILPTDAENSSSKVKTETYTCPVCGEILGEQTQLLYQNDDFIVVPDLGPLTIGHLLISPKAHYLSMAALPVEIIKKLELLQDMIRSKLNQEFDMNVVFFEHGSVSNDENRVKQGGNSVVHAHLHAIPVPRGFDILDELRENTSLKIRKVNTLLDLKEQIDKDTAYFFYEDTRGRKFIIDLAKDYNAPSQYMRILITDKLAEIQKQRGNWKTAPEYIGKIYRDDIRTTTRNLLGAFSTVFKSVDIIFLEEEFKLLGFSEKISDRYEKLKDYCHYEFNPEVNEKVTISDKDGNPIYVYFVEKRSQDIPVSEEIVFKRQERPVDWRFSSTHTEKGFYEDKTPDVMKRHTPGVGPLKDTLCPLCELPEHEILFRVRIENETMPVAININPVARENIMLVGEPGNPQYLTPKKIKQILIFLNNLGNGWKGYWNGIFGASQSHFHAHFHKDDLPLFEAIKTGSVKLQEGRQIENVTMGILHNWFSSGFFFRGSDIGALDEQIWPFIEYLTIYNIPYSIDFCIEHGEIWFFLFPRKKELAEAFNVQVQELLGEPLVGGEKAIKIEVGAYDLAGVLFTYSEELFKKLYMGNINVTDRVCKVFNKAMAEVTYKFSELKKFFQQILSQEIIPRREEGIEIFKKRMETVKSSNNDLFCVLGDMDKIQCLNRIYSKELMGDENNGILGLVFRTLRNIAGMYGAHLYRYLSGDEFGITTRVGTNSGEIKAMLKKMQRDLIALRMSMAVLILKDFPIENLNMLKTISGVVGAQTFGQGNINVLISLERGERPADGLNRILKMLNDKISKDIKGELHWFNAGYAWIPTVSTGAVSVKNILGTPQCKSLIDNPDQLYSHIIESATLVAKKAKKKRDNFIVVNNINELERMKSEVSGGIDILKEALDEFNMPEEDQELYDPLTGLLKRETLEGSLIRGGIKNEQTFIQITDTCYESKNFIDSKQRSIKWGPVYNESCLGARIMAINEFYGYKAGDQSVQLIAQAIRRSIPKKWGEVRIARAPPDKIQILADKKIPPEEILEFLDNIQTEIQNYLIPEIEKVRIKAVAIPCENVNSSYELLDIVEALRKIDEEIAVLPSPIEINSPAMGNVLAYYNINRNDIAKKERFNIRFGKYQEEDAREAENEILELYKDKIKFPLVASDVFSGLKNIVVVISGPHGVGKNTMAEMLARHTDLRPYNVGDIKRLMAVARGFDIMGYNEYLRSHPDEAQEINGFLDELQKWEMEKGGVIIYSYYGPYFAELIESELIKKGIKVIKILLNAPLEVRAKRIYENEKPSRIGESRMGEDEIAAALLERDIKDTNILSKLAGEKVDILRMKYDLIIDNSNKPEEETFHEILEYIISYLRADSWISEKDICGSSFQTSLTQEIPISQFRPVFDGDKLKAIVSTIKKEFLDKINQSSDKIAIFCHDDGDGISSATLLKVFLKEYFKKSEDMEIIIESPVSISDQLIKTRKEEGYKIVVLDLNYAPDAQSVDLLIDHHPQTYELRDMLKENGVSFLTPEMIGSEPFGTGTEGRLNTTGNILRLLLEQLLPESGENFFRRYGWLVSLSMVADGLEDFFQKYPNTHEMAKMLNRVGTSSNQGFEQLCRMRRPLAGFTELFLAIFYMRNLRTEISLSWYSNFC